MNENKPREIPLTWGSVGFLFILIAFDLNFFSALYVGYKLANIILFVINEKREKLKLAPIALFSLFALAGIKGLADNSAAISLTLLGLILLVVRQAIISSSNRRVIPTAKMNSELGATGWSARKERTNKLRGKRDSLKVSSLRVAAERKRGDLFERDLTPRDKLNKYKEIILESNSAVLDMVQEGINNDESTSLALSGAYDRISSTLNKATEIIDPELSTLVVNAVNGIAEESFPKILTIRDLYSKEYSYKLFALRQTTDEKNSVIDYLDSLNRKFDDIISTTRETQKNLLAQQLKAKEEKSIAGLKLDAKFVTDQLKED